MNCDDFDRRMQRLIDARIPIAGDDQLSRHASGCDDCGARMQWWQQIESVMPTGVPAQDDQIVSAGHRRDMFAWSMFAAVAAVLLVAFLVGVANRGAQVTPVASKISVSVDQQVDVDPARWWRDVQDRDWIGQTMPAVQSVRDGVAPLGRSIRHAVAILATGGRERTS